jgi:predicted metal-dependent hydrolase
MEISLFDKKYKVKVVKKNNKNTYIRVKSDLTILVTTSPFVTKRDVKNLLEKHKDFLIKNIIKKERQLENEKKFYYLGNKYDVIVFSSSKTVEIDSEKIYTPSIEKLEDWWKKQAKDIFSKQLLYNYHKFSEKIFLPKLKIRKMKTRWGVCNSTSGTITLNSELLRYELEVIDYVIIHELAHLIEPNHSKDFWAIVFKYCPNYKEFKNILRE